MHGVEQARAEVRQVREWLLRPSAETMGACVPSLERAAECLAEAGRDAGKIPVATVTALAEEIEATASLLRSAGELYFGAMRRLSRSAAESLGREAPERVSELG